MFPRWFGERRQIITQSPAFRFTYTNMSASTVQAQNLGQENATYGFFTPYNYIQVTNNTNNDVTLVFSTGITKTIVAGTIVSFDSATVPAFTNFQIQASSSGNTGTVEVIIQKVIDYKEAIRLQSGYSTYGQ